MDYPLFIYVLAVEALILVVLVLLICLHRGNVGFLRSIYKKRKAILSEYLCSLIEKKILFDPQKYPGKRKWSKQLLEVLESFDRMLQDEAWDQIREKLIVQFLIRRARRVAKSFSWRKRNFSARVFALFPFKEDEEAILTMMGDKEFIVRSPASLAAVRLGSEKGIHKALSALANEVGYTHFFYRDLLLQSSGNVFRKVIEFASDPQLHKACLSVLGAESWPAPIPFLKKDLESEDPEVRRLALKVLIRNPLPEGLDYFAKALLDADEEVIVTALNGLVHFSLDPFLQKLTELLQNPSWPIRLAAGRALKHAGEKGVKILTSQKEGPGFEAAQYAMVFS